MKGIDGLLVTNALCLRYVTGFTGSAGVALITEETDSKLVDIYKIVHDALRLTLQEVKVGMTGKEARLDCKGLHKGKRLWCVQCHGLGHGIGLNIHDDPFSRKTVKKSFNLAWLSR